MRDNADMQRRALFVLAWLAVTGVSVLIATQAVGAVGDQVTDTPATLAAAQPSPASTTAAPTTTVAPPITEPAVTSTSPSPTTTTGPETTTTTTAAPASTTQAPTTTSTQAPTTTEPPPEMETATYQLTGGWVRIRYGGGEVRLVDAAPNAGYSMKIEKNGPLKVEVEFEGDGYEGKFKADMEDGALDVDIEEPGDDED